MAEAKESRKSLKYEELVEARATAEAQNVILFDPNKCSLQQWLEENKPSEKFREDGIGWIAVESKQVKKWVPNVDETQNAWKELIQSNKQLAFSDILNLAKQYNNTNGKWLFLTSKDNVNNAWNLIASSMVSGGLGSLCYYAKVSPYQKQFTDDSPVIMVYNPNFTNKEEVFTINQELRKLGIQHTLMYKPDIYTHLRIYPKNPWNITAVIFVSAYNAEQKEYTFLNKPFYKSKPKEKVKNARNEYKNYATLFLNKFWKF